MKTHSWDYHRKAHTKSVPKKILAVSLIFTLSALFFHWLSFQFGSNFWISVTARLFYIPVIYSAIMGGLIAGSSVGIISGLMHAGLMFSLHSFQHIENTVLFSHLLETVFLLLIGFFTGALRDHEQHEKKLREEISGLLDRYVSPAVAEKLREKKLLQDGEEIKASVLFCDLAGFTSLSETVSPKELFTLLNKFFPEIVDILLSRNAFLDKFIGDAVMAVFGIPFTSEDDAERAVNSAVEIQNRLRKLNEERFFGNHSLRMSIGINSGLVAAGNVGSLSRASYTVIGDNVNLASRIQSLNGIYGTNTLISDETLKSVRNMENFSFREIDSVRVKGRKRPCVIFDLYSGDPENLQKAKRQTESLLMSALNYYKSGDFEKSEKMFLEMQKETAEDRIVGIYLERLAVLKKDNPKNWDGVFEFKTK
ncbi:MAG TPA: adenylate/guanylate cyclase domain-containing protein [Leptospiraceae bacterium]|nr:adenylate/guanylate cyclase domain-containing protein [Leptospiraceae bacterium]